VEFLRESVNGRLTLVLSKKSKPVRTLWALMNTNDLNVAKESLREERKRSLETYVQQKKTN
jgi:hypothetical protein